MYGILLVVVLMMGCGDKGDKTFEVTGTVSYRGSALSTGAVVFFPEKGRPLNSANIGPEGIYCIEAPAGAYSVAVIAMPTLQSNESDQKAPEQSAMRMHSLIPEFYSNPQTSGLQITVATDKPNKIDLVLR